MRGKLDNQALMLVALTPDQLVPQDHSIRQIKPIVDRALAGLSPTFDKMYAEVGRPIGSGVDHMKSFVRTTERVVVPTL